MDESSVAVARAVFEDRMLTDLTGAYDIDSVLAYPIKPNDAFGSGIGPSVSGKILTGESSEDSGKTPFVFRSVKVRLDRTAPWLVALFESKREWRRERSEAASEVFDEPCRASAGSQGLSTIGVVEARAREGSQALAHGRWERGSRVDTCAAEAVPAIAGIGPAELLPE